MTTTNRQSLTGFKSILLVGTSFTIGLAIGIFAVFAIQNSKSLNDQSTYESARGDKQQSSNNRDGVLENAVEFGQFQQIFEQGSTAEHYRALYTSLASASEQELNEWWNQSKKIERESNRKLAQIVILRNLTSKNPRQALQYLDDVSKFQLDELLVTVFSEWAVTDLDHAVDAAITLAGSRRTTALHAILEARDDLPDTERREIAVRLDGENTFFKLASKKKAEQNIVEPKVSWRILLDDNVDDSLQTESLAIVAEAWHAQVGFEVLSKIYSDIEDSRSESDLVNVIAQVAPAGALKYTIGLADEREQLILSRTIIREWARTDARAALATISTFEPSSLTSNLEVDLARTWARTKPNELIENIEAISEELRISPLEIAFAYVARHDPMDALDKLSSVENLVGNTSTIVESIVSEWTQQEPENVTEWVLTNYTREDPQRLTLLREILPFLAQKDPNHAFELALEQPAPSRSYEAEYYVVTTISEEGNIELAKELLPRVRKNSQPYAYGSVAADMVDVGQTSEAIELGKELEEPDQEFFYSTVFLRWSSKDPQNLFESLEDLPSSSIQSQAAVRLIRMNNYRPIFSDDQIERARTFLSAEDKADLE